MRRQGCAWRGDIGFCRYKHVAKGSSVGGNLQRLVFRNPIREHVEDDVLDRIRTLQHVLSYRHVAVEGLIRANVEIYVFEAVRVTIDDGGLDGVKPRAVTDRDDVRFRFGQSIELEVSEQP